MLKRKSNSNRPSKRLKQICALLESDPLNASVDFTTAETLEALVRILPQNARVQFEYASLLDRPIESLKYFQAAVDLDPKCAEFHFGLAQCLLASSYGTTCKCHNVSNVDLWLKRDSCVRSHMNLAYDLSPKNPDYIVAYADSLPYEEKNLQIKKIREALAIDEDHLEANKRFARFHHHWTSRNVDLKKVAEARNSAEKVLKVASAKSERARMHDIIAVCAEKQEDIVMARKHYDLALLTEPNEKPRNYHRFLKGRPQYEALYNIVVKMKRSFSVKEEVSVAAFFDRYAILTPGYRALLKKNNPTALILMKQYAQREVQWILLIPPFNDEMFPKVVTKAIMDFLFHI